MRLKMKRSLWVPVVLLCGIAAIAVGYVRGGSKKAEATRAPPHTQSTTAAEEPAELVPAPPVTVVQEAMNPSDVALADGAASVQYDDAQEVSDASPNVAELETAARYEDLFRQEARTSRGRALENVITTEFSAPDVVGTRVESLECRSSRCRLEVTFDDFETGKRMMPRLLLHGEIPLGGTIPIQTVREDGTMRVVVYLHPS